MGHVDVSDLGNALNHWVLVCQPRACKYDRFTGITSIL